VTSAAQVSAVGVETGAELGSAKGVEGFAGGEAFIGAEIGTLATCEDCVGWTGIDEVATGVDGANWDAVDMASITGTVTRLASDGVEVIEGETLVRCGVAGVEGVGDAGGCDACIQAGFDDVLGVPVEPPDALCQGRSGLVLELGVTDLREDKAA
jgi:hypothetical protein